MSTSIGCTYIYTCTHVRVHTVSHDFPPSSPSPGATHSRLARTPQRHYQRWKKKDPIHAICIVLEVSSLIYMFAYIHTQNVCVRIPFQQSCVPHNKLSSQFSTVLYRTVYKQPCVVASIITTTTQSGFHWHSDKHATRKILEAQYAFKILMIHEVLQFALRIAFRCVLHRCGSQDIHCWKL